MAPRHIWILVISLYLHIQRSDGAYNYSLEEDLRTLIFTTNSYNRFIPPDSVVTVSVGLIIYTMNKLEIKDETMDTSVFFLLTWNDTRFDWSGNSAYSSIPSIRSNSKHVWVPKVAVANTVSDLSLLGDEDLVVTALSSGLMSWITGKIDRTHCNCDVTYYPFDTQTCVIRLFLWGYSTDEVKLTFAQYPVDRTFCDENGEWEYIKYFTEFDDRTTEGINIRQLKFGLTYRRRPLFQFINSLLPVTLLSVLNSLLFKLPADSGEKIGFCLTVLLAFAVYVTIISDHIPTTSITTSYLSIYLISILALGVVSVCITIFVLHCHGTNPNEPIPTWLMGITTRIMMPVVCKRRAACCKRRCCFRRPTEVTDLMSNESEKEMHDDEDNTDITWKDISLIIDSFCFNVSLFVNVVIGAVMYIILAYGYSKY